jgi:hypothetical protein
MTLSSLLCDFRLVGEELVRAARSIIKSFVTAILRQPDTVVLNTRLACLARESSICSQNGQTIVFPALIFRS